MKFELKELITILGVAALLGGFYYTTEHRLSDLEANSAACSENANALQKKVNNLQRRIKKLEK